MISLLCAVFLGLFDKRAERFFKRESDVIEKIAFKDIIRFPLKFWLLIIICVIYYVTVNPFVGVSVYGDFNLSNARIYFRLYYYHYFPMAMQEVFRGQVQLKFFRC